MTTSRSVNVELNEAGDLVWNGHDIGPDVGILQPGATEYEFWRSVRAAHVPALRAALGAGPTDDITRIVRQRFESNVDLDAFATEHGIPTEFSSWITTNWDD